MFFTESSVARKIAVLAPSAGVWKNGFKIPLYASRTYYTAFYTVFTTVYSRLKNCNLLKLQKFE